MDNGEILAKLDIQKAIAELLNMPPICEAATIYLASLTGNGDDRGVLKIEFDKDEDVVGEFDDDFSGTVNPKYQKVAEPASQGSPRLCTSKLRPISLPIPDQTIFTLRDEGDSSVDVPPMVVSVTYNREIDREHFSEVLSHLASLAQYEDWHGDVTAYVDYVFGTTTENQRTIHSFYRKTRDATPDH